MLVIEIVIKNCVNLHKIIFLLRFDKNVQLFCEISFNIYTSILQPSIVNV